MMTDNVAVKWDGVAKIDLQHEGDGDACVARIAMPPRCHNGETVFVPRAGASAEDDGWLVTYVHDEGSGESSLHVYDAATMSSDAVAVVALPQRVPYGFHALFLNEREFQEQLARGGGEGAAAAAADAAIAA